MRYSSDVRVLPFLAILTLLLMPRCVTAQQLRDSRTAVAHASAMRPLVVPRDTAGWDDRQQHIMLGGLVIGAVSGCMIAVHNARPHKNDILDFTTPFDCVAGVFVGSVAGALAGFGVSQIVQRLPAASGS